jgi:iron(III) transport system substrate-binding protein
MEAVHPSESIRFVKLVCVASLLACAATAHAQSKPANVQADLDALVAAAKAEGSFLWYSAPPEGLAKRVSDAFTAKYGIRAQFVRLQTVPQRIRYSTEAEANNFAADLLVLAGGTNAQYAEAGIKKGWMEPIAAANLPVVKSGEFPAKYLTGPTAIVQISPWQIVYNTDKVKGADIPKDWGELANPKWKGQLILSGVSAGDIYAEFWSMLLKRYGESYVTTLRESGARRASGGGVPAAQQLSAGEGSIQIPNITSVTLPLAAKGAPIASVTPDYTTGVEQHVALTARSHSKNPNAARLFANYLMSPEGNALLNAGQGIGNMYESARMPRDYQTPNPEVVSQTPALTKLVGF